MTQPKLKPCPFCGGKSIIYESRVPNGDIVAGAGCTTCQAEMEWDADEFGDGNAGLLKLKDHAASAWGMRTTMGQTIDTRLSDRMAALLRKWADTEGPGNSIALWAERDELLREIEG